ncbi:hypothetical protein BDF20DRAFT_863159 [Mycotypha africana]|uniref:uncharacterized protein n=1 Tax=Mycotypha africana TaxID=64632 RepID=UPI0023016F0E|nr:uncharacterized protein BDF20DRAFT_863159 [Mycotypha africana]KAI8981775.1 hypothetical protein BDF20DRAFT_863159 [Mycotypha africana]
MYHATSASTNDTSSVTYDSNPVPIKIVIFCNNNAPLEFTFAPEKLSWDSLIVIMQSSSGSSLELPLILYYTTAAQPQTVLSVENQEQLKDLLRSLLTSIPLPTGDDSNTNQSNSMMTLRFYMDKDKVMTPVFVSSAAAFNRLSELINEHQWVIQNSRCIVRWIGMLASYIALNGCSGNNSFEPEFRALERMIERKAMKMKYNATTATAATTSTAVPDEKQPENSALSAGEGQDFSQERPRCPAIDTEETEDGEEGVRGFPPHPPHFMDPRMMRGPHMRHPFAFGPHPHHGHPFGFGSGFDFDKRRMFHDSHPRCQEGDEPLFNGLGDFLWGSDRHPHGPCGIPGPFGPPGHFGPSGHFGPFAGAENDFFGHFHGRGRPPHHPFFSPRGFFGDGFPHGDNRGSGSFTQQQQQHPHCPPYGPFAHFMASEKGGENTFGCPHGLGGGKRDYGCRRHHPYPHPHRGVPFCPESSSDSDMEVCFDNWGNRPHQTGAHFRGGSCHFHCPNEQQVEQEEQEGEISKKFDHLNCEETATKSTTGRR